MSPEEMASDARKSENAQIRKEALKESERGQHMKKVENTAAELFASISCRCIPVAASCRIRNTSAMQLWPPAAWWQEC